MIWPVVGVMAGTGAVSGIALGGGAVKDAMADNGVALVVKAAFVYILFCSERGLVCCGCGVGMAGRGS